MFQEMINMKQSSIYDVMRRFDHCMLNDTIEVVNYYYSD